jgi:DNA polymerase-3 subunit epsilon
MNYSLPTQIPSKDKRYVILNSKTTGIHLSTEHIIEISVIEINNGFLTGNQLHFHIKPRTIITNVAANLHGLQSDFYKKNFIKIYTSEKILLNNLIDFIGNSKIFAHDANFDRKFLNKELSYQNLPIIYEEQFICSMKLYKYLLGEHQTSYRLVDCCEMLNIRSNNSTSHFHSAISDAFMTARMICALWNLQEKKEYFEETSSGKKTWKKYENNDFEDLVSHKKKQNNDNVKLGNFQISDNELIDIKTEEALLPFSSDQLSSKSKTNQSVKIKKIICCSLFDNDAAYITPNKQIDKTVVMPCDKDKFRKKAKDIQSIKNISPAEDQKMNKINEFTRQSNKECLINFNDTAFEELGKNMALYIETKQNLQSNSTKRKNKTNIKKR